MKVPTWMRTVSFSRLCPASLEFCGRKAAMDILGWVVKRDSGGELVNGRKERNLVEKIRQSWHPVFYIVTVDNEVEIYAVSASVAVVGDLGSRSNLVA